MPIVGRLPLEVVRQLHPETIVDNFSELDCDLAFFSFVRSIFHRRNVTKVLDYGAGRNQYATDFDPTTGSTYVLNLRDLRYQGATVVAADVDEAVLLHPTSHRQVIVRPGHPLPFDDEQFDLIVSDYTFEHIEDAKGTCRELLRVLVPGGLICVRTPYKYGYVRVAAELVPNSLHVQWLNKIQPSRRAIDVFPTYYRLNSIRDIRAHFPSCRVGFIRNSWEPAYFFGNAWIYRLLRVAHKILPKFLSTAMIVFIQKPEARASAN